MKSVTVLLNQSKEEKDQEQMNYLLEDIEDFVKDSLKVNKRKLKNLKRLQEEAQIKCNTQSGLQSFIELTVQIENCEKDIKAVETIKIK
jgi:actin-related protein